MSTSQLAAVRCKRGELAAVEPLHRQAVERLQRSLGSGHWAVGQARIDLGECLLQKGRVGDAEAELVSGYRGLSAALGREHFRTQRALSELVRLYRQANRPADAARHSALLAAH